MFEDFILLFDHCEMPDTLLARLGDWNSTFFRELDPAEETQKANNFKANDQDNLFKQKQFTKSSLWRMPTTGEADRNSRTSRTFVDDLDFEIVGVQPRTRFKIVNKVAAKIAPSKHWRTKLLCPIDQDL